MGGRGAAGGGSVSGGFEARELSDFEKQMLDQVQVEREKQAANLDIVEEGLAVLKDMALTMKEEIDTTTQMTAEIIKQTEKADDDLNSLTNKVNDTVKEVDKQNWCVRLICVIVLLGILTIAYNLIPY